MISWTLSRAVPLLGPDGDTLEWFGAGSDMNAQREATISLRELNEALEKQIEGRTAERDQVRKPSPNPLAILDFGEVLHHANPA